MIAPAHNAEDVVHFPCFRNTLTPRLGKSLRLDRE